MKMKQRARQMIGDDLAGHSMGKKTDVVEHNAVQLHRIKPQEHFIEAQVQEGDTLQAIALRFYCSISELKRINHIHKDNEIFAKRTIKVPVTPYSVLTELIPTSQPEPVPSTSNNVTVPTTTGIQLLNTSNFNGILHQENVSVNQTSSTEDGHCAIDCNSVVMNSTLAPSVVPYVDSEQNEQATEGTQLLPGKEKSSVEAVVVKELTSHGADFGIKWFHLVCIMLILGVVIPLWYIMFHVHIPKHNVLEHSKTHDHD